MSRRQWCATVAVLALVALLYAGTAGLGLRSGTGDAGTRPGGLIGWLGQLTPKPPEVPRSGLSAPCLSGAVLTVPGDCPLSVAPGHGTRRVHLTAEAPLRVTARPPGGTTDATTRVAAGAAIDVTIDGGATTIGLACADATTDCTARLP